MGNKVHYCIIPGRGIRKSTILENKIPEWGIEFPTQEYNSREGKFALLLHLPPRHSRSSRHSRNSRDSRQFDSRHFKRFEKFKTFGKFEKFKRFKTLKFEALRDI